ncbi:FAD-binding oxidoreductase [Bradyrhizobium elkanii]|uniref:FAD-binding oxidoreductase n=1 Tax=Bradyrhizobium elkanii TaxID=29448 RepID=UPI001BA8791E|nr:FAD-binding oxidoreductase [Bradyrhizobium elkanii]MBR1159662.1 FAD-binding oxidoreductase [Bradyrhizobium elkanii]
MNVNSSSELAATRALRALMQGRVVSRGDDDYPRTRKIWNGAVENEPALFAVCETAVDVQAAVRIASQHGLPLSVRGGGHDWAGRALCPDGLVIDLSRMRQVIVDPQARVATVAGGAMAKEVAAAAGAHGLVAALGNCGTVGMAGLTLGGGYGPLSGTCGLAADNLLSAEIVLADGRRVTTGPDAEPELFWALRGGGGNFGVVTSLRVRLHPAREMLAGSIIYGWNEAGAVLHRYAAFAATAPDELGVTVGVMSGPDGEPVIMIVPLWNGERSQGERAIEGLRAFGSPLVAQVGPATYSDLLAQFDAWVEALDGYHWELRTRWLPALTAEAADVIIAAKARAPSPHCTVLWHHFHGAATRMASAGTAFGMRNEHLMIEIVAGWSPDGDGAAQRRWARDLLQSLAPFALPGGYANLLGPNDREQAAEAYGGNAARLRMLKRRIDPDGVFASAIPLPEQ